MTTVCIADVRRTLKKTTSQRNLLRIENARLRRLLTEARILLGKELTFSIQEAAMTRRDAAETLLRAIWEMS